MYSKLALVILLNVFINGIECFNAYQPFSNDAHCGLRYNDRIFDKEDMLESMVNGRMSSRALDDSSIENETAKTSMIISRQKQALGRLLGRLNQISALVDDKTKNDINKLKIDSRSLLTGKMNSMIEMNQQKELKKLTIRSLKSEMDAEFEARDLIKKARFLMGKIDMNMKIKTRIIGGKTASIKEFPWLGSLQTEDGSHLCGCSILTPYWVVTASHCITDKTTGQASTTKYVVGIGSSFWQKGSKHKVEKIFKHPGFTFTEFRNDVALLKLSQPIALKKGRITPICLPPKGSEVLGSGTIAGWGITANENVKPSDALMRVNVEILEDKLCAHQYSNYNRNEMVCAGKYSGGIDSCQGDSGGPLQSVLSNGRVYLIGLTSFGDRCGRPYFPGVYTKVSNYIDWIYGIIEQNSIDIPVNVAY